MSGFQSVLEVDLLVHFEYSVLLIVLAADAEEIIDGALIFDFDFFVERFLELV